MKLYAVTWSYFGWDEGDGGLDSIWSTRELAEAQVKLRENDRYNGHGNHIVEEFELDGGSNE